MIRIAMLTLTFALSLSTAAFAQTPAVPQSTESGLAAVYAEALNGRVTASGQIYDQTKLTAAHKTLPFGTKVRVTNAKNGKVVELRINDRGPRQAGRVLDITPAAAARLGFSKLVMRDVTVEIIELGNGKTTRQR